MSRSHLVILRPCKYGNYQRLGLFTEEFQDFTRDQNVAALYVDFGEGKKKVDSISTYVKYGSITDSDIVNAWLSDNQLTERNDLILFELEIDKVKKEHLYRYIGTAEAIMKIIENGKKRLNQ